jgi:hypothetical protein
VYSPQTPIDCDETSTDPPLSGKPSTWVVALALASNVPFPKSIQPAAVAVTQNASQVP